MLKPCCLSLAVLVTTSSTLCPLCTASLTGVMPFPLVNGPSLTVTWSVFGPPQPATSAVAASASDASAIWRVRAIRLSPSFSPACRLATACQIRRGGGPIPVSAGEVVVEPGQRAGPGVLRRFRLVAVALVAVEAVAGLGVADDFGLLARRRRRRPQLLDTVDRDALVEVAVEPEPRRPQPRRLLDQRPEAEAAFGHAAAVESVGGAEVAPGGGDERHRAAHAEADDPGLPEGDPRPGQVVEGSVDVGHHPVGGQLLHVRHDHRHVAVAELGVAAAVEEVGGHRQPALGGEAPGDVLDVVVDAERLLDHDDAALGRPVRLVDRERGLFAHASDTRRARKSTLSRMTYCAIHSDPKAATLAPSAASVRPAAPKPAWPAQAATTLTAAVDRPSPANDRAQNGPISAQRERGPPFPHTQHRLSSNDGTVPTPTAITLAQPGLTAPVATRTPSTVRLVTDEMAETVA